MQMQVYEVTKDLTLYIKNSDNVVAVFYGEIDFEVRLNGFVRKIVNQLLNVDNEKDRIFLLQVLKSIETEAVSS